MPDHTDPDLYDDAAETFDRYTERTGAPLTECFVEMTEMRPGMHTLDVACGSGIATRRAADAVGPEGRTVGIDLSPGQIRVARSRGPARIEYFVMDAMALDLPDGSFDVVTARYPHFPSRAGALSEMARVLRPGGRLAICHGGGGGATWPLSVQMPAEQPPPAASVDGLFLSLMDSHFPNIAGRRAGNAPASTVDPREALTADLRAAGLNDIALWSFSYSSPFHSADDAWDWEVVRHSPYRMNAHTLSDAEVAGFNNAYRERADAVLAEHGVLALGTGAMFGVATRS